jgi:primosomal protein N' (replication factor Y)
LREKIRKWKLPPFPKTPPCPMDIPPHWGRAYLYTFNFSKELTKEQEKVYNTIKNSKNNEILLFGVTGSWKTEIYIKLIKDYLDSGKQVLFLIPEIILWNQILERIQKIFWKDVIILNSSVSEAKKTQYFLDILQNKAKIILWTRSALFYPYDNLWLIIVDEEHDQSYISDQSPRYNAVEVAKEIAKNWEWIKLLLASWTPSVNSMYLGLKGEYEIVNLLEKFWK